MDGITFVDGADDGAIADRIGLLLTDALRRSAGTVAICLPGGTTPAPVLRRMAGMPLDWSRMEIWPGDDRMVPESHPASNAGAIRAILGPCGAAVIPLRENARPPHFAFVWLGMGRDGHIASLFPSSDPRPDDPRGIVRVTPEPLPVEAPFERISLTIPALLDADAIIFVIRGEEKRALFAAAARGENDLPVARLLAAATRPVTCFT